MPKGEYQTLDTQKELINYLSFVIDNQKNVAQRALQRRDPEYLQTFSVLKQNKYIITLLLIVIATSAVLAFPPTFSGIANSSNDCQPCISPYPVTLFIMTTFSCVSLVVLGQNQQLACNRQCYKMQNQNSVNEGERGDLNQNQEIEIIGKLEEFICILKNYGCDYVSLNVNRHLKKTGMSLSSTNQITQRNEMYTFSKSDLKFKENTINKEKNVTSHDVLEVQVNQENKCRGNGGNGLRTYMKDVKIGLLVLRHKKLEHDSHSIKKTYQLRDKKIPQTAHLNQNSSMNLIKLKKMFSSYSNVADGNHNVSIQTFNAEIQRILLPRTIDKSSRNECTLRSKLKSIQNKHLIKRMLKQKVYRLNFDESKNFILKQFQTGPISIEDMVDIHCQQRGMKSRFHLKISREELLKLNEFQDVIGQDVTALLRKGRKRSKSVVVSSQFPLTLKKEKESVSSQINLSVSSFSDDEQAISGSKSLHSEDFFSTRVKSMPLRSIKRWRESPKKIKESSGFEESQSNSLDSSCDIDQDTIILQVDLVTQQADEEGGFSITHVYVQDVSCLIRKQQILSDQIYQTAIEANYSHEQMTPLNSILTNSRIILSKIKDINTDRIFDVQTDEFIKMTRDMTKQVLYSAQIMHYYNQNQIEMMRIKKGKADVNPIRTVDPEEFIKQVMQPFEYQIKTRKIAVEITRSNDFSDCTLKTDWRLYQLAIFNVIQNSVKYNYYGGKINIQLRLNRTEASLRCAAPASSHSKEMSREPTHIIHHFETIINDTGIGIEKERLPLLFKPFGELRQKQSMAKVKDNGIGVGLSCSKVMLEVLKGQIEFVQRAGFSTSVKINIPVEVIDISAEQACISQISDFYLSQKFGFGEDLVTSKFLNQYKNDNKQERIQNFKKIKVVTKRDLPSRKQSTPSMIKYQKQQLQVNPLDLRKRRSTFKSDLRLNSYKDGSRLWVGNQKDEMENQIQTLSSNQRVQALSVPRLVKRTGIITSNTSGGSSIADKIAENFSKPLCIIDDTSIQNSRKTKKSKKGNFEDSIIFSSPQQQLPDLKSLDKRMDLNLRPQASQQAPEQQVNEDVQNLRYTADSILQNIRKQSSINDDMPNRDSQNFQFQSPVENRESPTSIIQKFEEPTIIKSPSASKSMLDEIRAQSDLMKKQCMLETIQNDIYNQLHNLDQNTYKLQQFRNNNQMVQMRVYQKGYSDIQYNSIHDVELMEENFVSPVVDRVNNIFNLQQSLRNHLHQCREEEERGTPVLFKEGSSNRMEESLVHANKQQSPNKQFQFFCLNEQIAINDNSPNFFKFKNQIRWQESERKDSLENHEGNESSKLSLKLNQLDSLQADIDNLSHQRRRRKHTLQSIKEKINNQIIDSDNSEQSSHNNERCLSQEYSFQNQIRSVDSNQIIEEDKNESSSQKCSKPQSSITPSVSISGQYVSSNYVLNQSQSIGQNKDNDYNYSKSLKKKVADFNNLSEQYQKLSGMMPHIDSNFISNHLQYLAENSDYLDSNRQHNDKLSLPVRRMNISPIMERGEQICSNNNYEQNIEKQIKFCSDNKLPQTIKPDVGRFQSNDLSSQQMQSSNEQQKPYKPMPLSKSYRNIRLSNIDFDVPRSYSGSGFGSINNLNFNCQSSGDGEINESINNHLLPYRNWKRQLFHAESVSSTCNCQQTVMIVDDNLFNLQPLKFLIEDMEIAHPRVQQNNKNGLRSNKFSFINEEEEFEEEKMGSPYQKVQWRNQSVVDNNSNKPYQTKSVCPYNQDISQQSVLQYQNQAVNKNYSWSPIDQGQNNNKKFKTDQATNGQEAIDMFSKKFYGKCNNPLCRDYHYKLIIMDLQMPVIDGFEASRQIIEMLNQNPDPSRHDECHIVALTSYTDDDTLERCEKLGIKQVINKPIDQKQLKKLVYVHHLRMSEDEAELLLNCQDLEKMGPHRLSSQMINN